MGLRGQIKHLKDEKEDHSRALAEAQSEKVEGREELERGRASLAYEYKHFKINEGKMKIDMMRLLEKIRVYVMILTWRFLTEGG